MLKLRPDAESLVRLAGLAAVFLAGTTLGETDSWPAWATLHMAGATGACLFAARSRLWLGGLWITTLCATWFAAGWNWQFAGTCAAVLVLALPPSAGRDSRATPTAWLTLCLALFQLVSPWIALWDR